MGAFTKTKIRFFALLQNEDFFKNWNFQELDPDLKIKKKKSHNSSSELKEQLQRVEVLRKKKQKSSPVHF
jgi:N-acetylglutamate synthase-like GNAT family acetyltransferase